MGQSAGSTKFLKLTLEEIAYPTIGIRDEMVEGRLGLRRTKDPVEISVTLDDVDGHLALIGIQADLAGGLERGVGGGEVGRVRGPVERGERLEHVLEQRPDPGLRLGLRQFDEDLSEESHADRQRQRCRPHLVRSGPEARIHSLPPIIDAGAKLLGLGREALGANEQRKGVDGHFIAVAHDDGGGLAALEHRGEQLVVAVAELCEVELGERIALGVLQGDAGEVEDVGLLEELEERLTGKGVRNFDRDHDLPDERLK